MIHATLIIEDTILTATDASEGKVKVICVDSFNGQRAEGVWTYPQFNAVVALSLGMGEDDSIGSEATEKLYAIARPLLTAEAGWNPEVRPIP